MLRREGFAGRLTLISHDAAPPVDRPNLSKDYLAGTAPEEWIPLRPPEFFAEQGIELVLGTRVSGIDVERKEVKTQEGGVFPFDAMLLATGAEPRRLAIPGADLPHVFYLRSLADSRAIIERAKSARRAVVIGGSFIGLEVAAALRARDIDVQVVAPDRRPLERIMGPQIGDFVRALHESHGVVFHLGQTPVSIDSSSVTLPNASLAADLVVVGVGVKPRTELAEQAGLALDRGVVVSEYLESSVPGIFAAGDIARWPDRTTGESIRVEHWAVAQRQGQVAAKNMLGQKVPYAVVPFFWSQHYDVRISYVGHAERWDKLDLGGDVARQDFTVSLRSGSRTTAVITVGRDLESLAAEVALERGDAKALEAFGSK
jgi:NADPH-dependent 2,4-dienoyl-CoA reductase/sulfur reductase-like enzyme